jgi:hypothetical protein
MNIRKIMNIFRGNNSNATVNIDGHSYSGQTVSITNGKVVIDGVVQEQSLIGPISIVVNGSVDRIDSASGDVTVMEGCGDVKTMSGDVTCRGNVTGRIETMSGDVHVTGHIGGSVETMSGDIIQSRE